MPLDSIDTSSKPALISTLIFLSYKFFAKALGLYDTGLDLIIGTATAIVVVATAIQKAPIIIDAIKKLFNR